MDRNELYETARALVADNRGILAADESSGTIEKRFDSISLASTEENRRAYRDMLFTTPELEQYVSGVILFDETIRQSSADGTAFPELLAGRGIIPGIKVDTGAKDLAGAPGEKVTEGLDGLRERLEEYRGLGARFAKWRAVITIGDGIPTSYCIYTNAHALARYAALCQEQGLVPIVEPEVLMDADNDIERCYDATARTLHAVFHELYHQKVDLRGILLKPNMVISGKGAAKQASAQEVAEWTIRCFREHVPGGGARHRLPLRRPVRRAGEREPERDQLAGRTALDALLLVRSRAPGACAEGVGRRGGERRGRPVLPRAARAEQQRGRRGSLQRRHGGARPLELAGIDKEGRHCPGGPPVDGRLGPQAAGRMFWLTRKTFVGS